MAAPTFTNSYLDISTEASDLGWKPGEYHRMVVLDGTVFRFLSIEYNSQENEVFGWLYRAENGQRLFVMND
jgi:hypothetical protein